MPTSFPSICGAAPVRVANRVNMTCCSLRGKKHKNNSKAECIHCKNIQTKYKKIIKKEITYSTFSTTHTLKREHFVF